MILSQLDFQRVAIQLICEPALTANHSGGCNNHRAFRSTWAERSADFLRSWRQRPPAARDGLDEKAQNDVFVSIEDSETSNAELRKRFAQLRRQLRFLAGMEA